MAGRRLFRGGRPAAAWLVTAVPVTAVAAPPAADPALVRDAVLHTST